MTLCTSYGDRHWRSTLPYTCKVYTHAHSRHLSQRVWVLHQDAAPSAAKTGVMPGPVLTDVIPVSFTCTFDCHEAAMTLQRDVTMQKLSCCQPHYDTATLMGHALTDWMAYGPTSIKVWPEIYKAVKYPVFMSTGPMACYLHLITMKIILSMLQVHPAL